jgi:serine/threonine-protein kinase
MQTPSEFRPAGLARYFAGQVVAGKYRLDLLLGEGGMGAVWRALNLQLEAPIALKLIRADLERAQLGLRLKQEARAAAKVVHPAIVRVFDVGESELGDPFIVMELLSGQSLAALLAVEQRLPALRAVQLLLPIADGLSAAHAKGIIHRDLKPDNVFITIEDDQVQPKLLDFGIAKLTDPKPLDAKLTQAGVILGSPDYMSPEQARGREDVDQRTDVWSFSAMLYEVVAGMTPFSGANHRALLRSIVEDEPPPLMDLAAADKRLWAVIRRGLSKNVDDRFRTMNELGRALAAWLIEHGVHEDVSGGSLEAKWISRASDPAGQRISRASLASLTSSPPESGIRSALHSAPTLASTSTRSSATSKSSGAAQPRRSRLYLTLGFAALLAAALAFALGTSRPSRIRSALERDRRAPTAPTSRPASAPPPTPEVAPGSPASADIAAVQPRARRLGGPVPVKPEKRPLPTSSIGDSRPAELAPVAPKSDLLSPY